MYTILDYPNRGTGGNSKYRGNCSPHLIEDLIRFFHWETISDYMVGSGTTADVASSLGITSHCYDLHSGFNLMTDDIPERNPAVFWHPPYWDMVTYSGVMYNSADVQLKYGYNPDEYDLSRAKTWEDFVKMMNYCCLKQYMSLENGGRMAVLVGDIKKKGRLYSMLIDLAKPGTVENILIKKQHNCFSDHTNYHHDNFIHINHEYVVIFRKDSPLIVPVKITKDIVKNVMSLSQISWKDLIASVLEAHGGSLSLSSIYDLVMESERAKTNHFPKEKVRQTLYKYPIFSKCGSEWVLSK